MPEGEPQPDKTENARAALQLAFSVLAQIGLFALGAIVVAIIGGILLDKQFHTRPLFTLLFLLASIPLTYYIIYRVALNAVAKTKTTAAKPSRMKEEMQRDDNAEA